MEELKKHFDDFTFHARVMPVLVIMLPVLALSIFKGVVDGDLLENALYFTMVLIFLSFTSRVAREIGKKYEAQMYSELKGMPTTIVLRFSDDTLDKLTKARYHKKLNEQRPDLMLPLTAEDENAESDSHYISAINWLRNYANSNRDTEFRVYQELKEYNFWRNLYGSRAIALIVYSLIAIREIILMGNFSIQEMFIRPFPGYIALIIMGVSILMLLAFVNHSTVKRKAFDYARALVEVCERL